MAIDPSKQPRLTQYSRAGGCGCKVSSASLRTIIDGIAPARAPDLLVGLDAFDDAAVLQLSGDAALALTIDAFTPLFDDPRTFGRVAAANSLSDIYAMGLKPVLAQGFLGWPVDTLPLDWAHEVLAGAVALCESVGVAYAGGHTIASLEPIFGLCVNGLGPAANVKRNSGARAGDLLFLTKPLGSGILSTAEKKGLLNALDRAAALAYITAPNTVGESLGNLSCVRALTDVTGFGLIGHLLEMTGSSNTQVRIDYDALRVMQGTGHYLDLGCETSGGGRNRQDVGDRMHLANGRDDRLLMDPQTNGGLLIACDPAGLSDLVSVLCGSGLSAFASALGVFEARHGPRQVLVV